jgi:hypothetical protein
MLSCALFSNTDFLIDDSDDDDGDDDESEFDCNDSRRGTMGMLCHAVTRPCVVTANSSSHNPAAILPVLGKI